MQLIANIVGILGAVFFVGYFAYSINETPLTVIVVISLALMVYAFYDDMRRDRAVSRAKNERNG